MAKLHAPFGPLSVTLAGAQLGQPQPIERLEQLLEQSGLEPSRLQLEITESFIMNQTEEAPAVLHGPQAPRRTAGDRRLRHRLPSLSYLPKRLPLDILKIDKSFIRGLPDDPHDAAITAPSSPLGRSMQLTVIAEGVETEGQQSLTHERPRADPGLRPQSAAARRAVRQQIPQTAPADWRSREAPV